ncbi:MAG: hypothetical protein RL297_1440 [Pseudomonadota bacterium]|jgi:hypothetical protein
MSKENKQKQPSVNIQALMQDVFWLRCKKGHDDLYNSLQAIVKRQLYCEYHYDLFLKSTKPHGLIKERLSTSAEYIRIEYEANAIAFIEQLHSLFDSFPYVLKLIYSDLTSNTKDQQLRWDEKFIDLFKEQFFYQSLSTFNANSLFKMLKEICNQAKHRYPVRIANKLIELRFEDFELYKKIPTHIDDDLIQVEVFMRRSHDELIPLFLNLLQTVHEDIRRISDDQKARI